MRKPDVSLLAAENEIEGDNPSETKELLQLLEEAKNYLGSFRWCSGILESYCGIAAPGVFGVFLFGIEPATDNVDDWLWVVVGDLPPAYITAENANTPHEALEGYIYEMKRWASAVEEGASTEELIPVNVPPTKENASMLKSRLRLLEGYVQEEE